MRHLHAFVALAIGFGTLAACTTAGTSSFGAGGYVEPTRHWGASRGRDDPN